MLTFARPSHYLVKRFAVVEHRWDTTMYNGKCFTVGHNGNKFLVDAFYKKCT